MNFKKNLVLLGMMASGKSTIGKLVSRKLGLKFYDIDKLIEDEMRMTISEIFNNKSEIFFRSLEEKITLRILENKNTVISLGGGSFFNDKIQKEILNNHVSFWLNCSNNLLIKRIRKNNKRPIANKLNNKELVYLISSRKKIYKRAKFKINCDKLSKQQITTNIINLYETI
tara:strand:- start:928 stop:1440 length:513 start_codon:yes stop_codon:yes gene_type:complete